MTDEINDSDFSKWLSTYGLLTAERIMEGFQIRLRQEELITAIKNPRSIYYQLLQIPMKNVMNGIIRQQAHDYQVYAQKLFIDFLLSGQSDQSEESPGLNTRNALEEERAKLITMGENFNAHEEEHLKFIGETQLKLINLAKELKKALLNATNAVKEILQNEKLNKGNEQIQEVLRTALVHGDSIHDLSSPAWQHIEKFLGISLSKELRGKMSETLKTLNSHREEANQFLDGYLEKVEDISANLRADRSQFYQLILHTTELVQLLPDYRLDESRSKQNKASLNFDAKIGDKPA